MALEKAGIGLASLALALSPALAQASPTTHGKPESTHGKGAKQRSESGSQHTGGEQDQGRKSGNARHAKPAKCRARTIAYIASGTLLSDTLTKNENNTYKGQVTVEVTHTNRHAQTARGETETYTLEAASIRGPIGIAAVAQGDRVKLIGTITAIGAKCESSAFTPTIDIAKLIFHAPRPATSSTPTP